MYMPDIWIRLKSDGGFDLIWPGVPVFIFFGSIFEKIWVYVLFVLLMMKKSEFPLLVSQIFQLPPILEQFSFHTCAKCLFYLTLGDLTRIWPFVFYHYIRKTTRRRPVSLSSNMRVKEYYFLCLNIFVNNHMFL